MTNEELDAAVAIKVMGWTLCDSAADVIPYYVDAEGTTVRRASLWSPTTDARDTERVIAKLQELGWQMDISIFGSGASVEMDVSIFGSGASVDTWKYGDVRPRVSLSDPGWKRAACLAAVEAFKEN